jgi:hypothetical protein
MMIPVDNGHYQSVCRWVVSDSHSPTFLGFQEGGGGGTVLPNKTETLSVGREIYPSDAVDVSGVDWLLFSIHFYCDKFEGIY